MKKNKYAKRRCIVKTTGCISMLIGILFMFLAFVTETMKNIFIFGITGCILMFLGMIFIKVVEDIEFKNNLHTNNKRRENK